MLTYFIDLIGYLSWPSPAIVFPVSYWLPRNTNSWVRIIIDEMLLSHLSGRLMSPTIGIWSPIKVMGVECDDLQHLTSRSRPLRQGSPGPTRN